MDDLAREYLLLALSLGQLQEGIVDSYYGPPELRAEATARNATPAALAAEAANLRERVGREASGQRARWLDRQLIALETLSRRLAGDEMPYVDEVTAYFDATPEQTAPEAYTSVRRQLDELLPGTGDAGVRLAKRDERLTVAPERLPEIVGWLVDEIRTACGRVMPVPGGESLSLHMVSKQPWSAYNWYDGGLRSRIEINTDLPVRAHQLIGLVTHEAFPGHHLEHAWKEARLAREQDRGEATVQLINAPEAYISEGLAEVGGRLVISAEQWQSLLLAACEQAGIELSADDAAREWEIGQALRAIRGSGGDAALMLHVARHPPEHVLRFLQEDALRSAEQAAKNLEFITHPLWRAYVFCYAGGEGLLTRWCDSAGDDTGAQIGRFFRLLTEQLTPSGIAEELAETPSRSLSSIK